MHQLLNLQSRQELALEIDVLLFEQYVSSQQHFQTLLVRPQTWHIDRYAELQNRSSMESRQINSSFYARGW